MTWYRAPKSTGLSWANVPAALDSLNTAINAAAGNASFAWEVCSFQSASPGHVMIRRKDGSPGRILIFGGSATPAVAAMATGVTASANLLYAGYARSSTENSPANYTTLTPLIKPDFSGGMVFRGGFSGTASIQLYSKSDQLVLAVWTGTSTMDCMLFAGRIYSNNANTETYDGISVAGQPSASAADAVGLFAGPASFQTTSVSAASDGRAYFTNDWFRVNRIASFTGISSAATLQLFTDIDNNVIFYPYMGATTPEISSTFHKRWIKARNVAFGLNKTEGYEWKDSSLNSRGFYIGYSLTADIHGMTLTHVDM